MNNRNPRDLERNVQRTLSTADLLTVHRRRHLARRTLSGQSPRADHFRRGRSREDGECSAVKSWRVCIGPEEARVMEDTLRYPRFGRGAHESIEGGKEAGWQPIEIYVRRSLCHPWHLRWRLRSIWATRNESLGGRSDPGFVHRWLRGHGLQPTASNHTWQSAFFCREGRCHKCYDDV